MDTGENLNPRIAHLTPTNSSFGIPISFISSLDIIDDERD